MFVNLCVGCLFLLTHCVEIVVAVRPGEFWPERSKNVEYNPGDYYHIIYQHKEDDD